MYLVFWLSTQFDLLTAVSIFLKCTSIQLKELIKFNIPKTNDRKKFLLLHFPFFHNNIYYAYKLWVSERF